jgi:hypothetical protein
VTKTVKAVRYDEIGGKTVSGCGWNESEMIVAFTDGTVLALQADSDCDNPSIDFEQGSINLHSWAWVMVAKEAGLVSRDEYLAVCAERNAERAKRLELELAQLKAAVAREAKS